MKGTKDTKYVFPKKEDVEIVVGDENQDRFYPRMKIMRWDNEVNFSVGVISDHSGSHSKPSDKVEWDDGHGTKAVFYEKEGDEFEFEIELASKPASNVIELSIETKGLRFLYQPPLTQQEIDDGYERPENVVGSYAVYHQTMQGNYLGGKNYRAGKFCHIYRPFVIDAKGKQAWCDMDITGNVLKITIPDGLVYPVVIDPTFGIGPDVHGGSWANEDADDMRGSYFTSPANIDTAQNINAYVRRAAFPVNNFHIKNAIILYSNLTIISNGIGSESVLVTGDGEWVESDFATDPSPATSTNYFLMCISDQKFRIAYDSGDPWIGGYDSSNNYVSPQDLGSVIPTNHDYSIYCTYTAGAPPTGGSPAGKALNGSLWGPFAGPIV